jgi:hypothetical protein
MNPDLEPNPGVALGYRHIYHIRMMNTRLPPLERSSVGRTADPGSVFES